MAGRMTEPHEFLAEDVGSGDITSEALAAHANVKAAIITKDDCVVAGMDVAAEIFRHVGLDVKIIVRDGENVRKGTAVMEIYGPARALLGRRGWPSTSS
jgi:nicotinate-nucleotide pyrophosphorylase (carboxylating)